MDTSHNVTIFMSSDSYFLPYTVTAIASIMENAHDSTRYEIFVLTSGVSETLTATTDKWFEQYQHGTLRFIDVDSRMDAIGRERFHVTPNLPLATYFRFLAPTLFEDYARILYLDADIIVLSDLSELFNADLDGNTLGACHDIWQEQCYANEPRFREYFADTLKMTPEDGYFNAGILLLDLDIMRGQHLQEQFFEAVDRIPEPYLKDQDILNSVCKNNVCFLPGKWNLVDWMADPDERNETFHFASPEIQEYCRALRKDCGILHYMGEKPWSARYAGSLDNLYWRYSRNTPFHSVAVQRLSDESGILPSAATFFHSGFHLLRSALGCWFGSAGKKEKNIRRVYRFKEEVRRVLTKRKISE